MRAPQYDALSGLNKGAWTAEEDKKLLTYINKYGIWNWCKMPPYAGNYNDLVAIHHVFLKIYRK